MKAVTDIDDPDHLVSAAKRVLEQRGQAFDLARQLDADPLVQAMKAIQQNEGIQRILEDAEWHRSVLRAVEGPLAELRATGAFDAVSAVGRQLQRANEALTGFESRFELPEVRIAASLVQSLHTSPFADVMTRYAAQATTLQKSLEAMTTPWLDIQDNLRSVGALAAMNGMAGILEQRPGFDVRVADALRIDLGDWRDPIAWPQEIFTDLGARSAFYVERGFDPALTDLPAPAFRQGTQVTGLRRSPPPLVREYEPPVPVADDPHEEEALARTNDAHDWLLRLETQIRHFIDLRMSALFGPDWPRHRMHKDIYDRWLDKKKKREQHAVSQWPLIAYADFTDYERIICRKDNWQEVFAPFFIRPESVRETFQRLYPIRLDTMHARPITQDDELLLYVETRRLIRLILG